MTKAVLSILRQAAEPLTSRDIALELLVTRALDKDEASRSHDEAGGRDAAATAGQRHCALGERAGAVHDLGDRALASQQCAIIPNGAARLAAEKPGNLPRLPRRVHRRSAQQDAQSYARSRNAARATEART
jgi:hypothetical protein